MATIIKQKETFRRVLQCTDLKSGAVLDLTGVSAYSQMRKYPGGELIGTAQCTVNEKKGEIEVLWTASQTEYFPLGSAGYDVWLTFEGDQKPIYTETVEIGLGYTENIGE